MKFVLPYRTLASVNIRLKPGGHGLKLSTKYSNRKYAAYLLLLDQRERNVRPDADQEWALLMDFRFPDRLDRKRDADNYVKMIMDALEGVIYDDDNQVTYHDCRVLTPHADPGVIIQALHWPPNDRYAGLVRTTDIR